MQSGQDYCSEQVLVNMNKQDMNEWTGGCCCGYGYLCCALFLDVFSENVFPERAAHSKRAMIERFLLLRSEYISECWKCIHGMFLRGT